MRSVIIGLGLWLSLFIIAVVADAPAAGPASSSGLTILAEDTPNRWIDEGIAYFFEPQPMGFDQAARLEPTKWTPISRKIPNLGADFSPVWLRFDVLSTARERTEWFLAFTWAYLNRIELSVFHHDTKTWDPPLVSGSLVPMSQRPLVGRHFMFPLKLNPDERATVYLRIVSNSKLILPIKIWQKHALRESLTDQYVVLGLFFGMMVVMMCYNFLLYLPTKDKSFLYFAFFVLSIIFYTLMASGIGTLYFWDRSIWLKSHAYGVFSSFCFLTAAIFIRRYFWLKKYGGWILKLSNVIIIYWSLSIFLSGIWSSPLLIIMEDLAGVISTVAGMVTGIYCWIKKDPSARIFNIAWISLGIGTILLILSLAGIIEQTWITTYSQRISFTLVVMLLSFALAERINRERTARSDAQYKALELSDKIADERAAKLDAQQRMLEVQQQINQELEVRVKERSGQLKLAMQRLETANEDLSRLNITDALTKVNNRRYFDQVMQEEIRRANLNGQPLAVVMADIDHFKAVNDTYGHLVGDEALKLVAETLKKQVSRKNHLVARYGGEEFAMILPSTPADDALLLADQARVAVQNLTFESRGEGIALRISLGVAAWVPRAGDPQDLLVQTADRALYRAKQKGRNRVVVSQVD